MTITESDLVPFQTVATTIYPQFEKGIGRDVIQAVLDAK